LIVVDEMQLAQTHAGDLLWVIGRGRMEWHDVVELEQVIAGKVELPDLSRHTLIFRSLGLNLTDIAIAAKAFKRAVARGVSSPMSM
jgi:ornithine cyclodeaminase/alanine dehydrogenase-like protein (mu-crystallin family)